MIFFKNKALLIGVVCVLVLILIIILLTNFFSSLKSPDMSIPHLTLNTPIPFEEIVIEGLIEDSLTLETRTSQYLYLGINYSSNQTQEFAINLTLLRTIDEQGNSVDEELVDFTYLKTLFLEETKGSAVNIQPISVTARNQQGTKLVRLSVYKLFQDEKELFDEKIFTVVVR